jgi:hypothetical protein
VAGRGGGLLADLGKERIDDFADPRTTCDSVTAPNTIASARTLTKMNAAHVLDAPLSIFSKKASPAFDSRAVTFSATSPPTTLHHRTTTNSRSHIAYLCNIPPTLQHITNTNSSAPTSATSAPTLLQKNTTSSLHRRQHHKPPLPTTAPACKPRDLLNTQPPHTL